MAASESVIINTLLVGAREFVAGVQTEVASLRELGVATGLAGAEMNALGTKTFIANQALFTTRRVAYAGTLALLAAGAAALKLGWNYSNAMQQARVALDPVFGTTKALNNELNYLYKFSSFTPFQFKDITIAFRQMYLGMHTAGISAKTVNVTLHSIADALAATGRTTPGALNRVAIALQHMAYMGHLTGQVVLQLARDGLPIYAALTKELGLTGDQIHRIGAMNILPQQALDALNKFIETYPGTANAAFRQATMTLHGAFITFKDLLSQAASGGESGLFGGLTHFFQRVDKQLQPYVNNGKPITFQIFVNSIDKVLSPKTHLVLDFFAFLTGVVGGLSLAIKGLVGAIGLVLLPLRLLGGGGRNASLAIELLGYFVGALLALMIAMRVRLIAGAIAMSAYEAVLWGVTVAEGAAAFAAGAFSAVMTLLDAIVVATAFEFTLLDAAFLLVAFRMAVLVPVIESVAGAFAMLDLFLGPVGWIALAIGAVTLLYFRWKWFHNLINGIFSWLKGHWPYLFSILAGPFMLAEIAITRYFGAIKRVVTSTVDWIAHKLNWLGDKMKGLWNKIPGHGVVGRVAHGLGGIVGLAGGGKVTHPGLAMVGESGPELLSLPAGASVAPLDKAYHIGGLVDMITIKIYPQDIYLDGRKVASAVGTAVTGAEARL